MTRIESLGRSLCHGNEGENQARVSKPGKLSYLNVISRIWEGPTDDGRQLMRKKTVFGLGGVFNVVAIIIVDVVGFAINTTRFELCFSKGKRKTRICRLILLNWIAANTSNGKCYLTLTLCFVFCPFSALYVCMTYFSISAAEIHFFSAGFPFFSIFCFLFSGFWGESQNIFYISDII